MASPRVLAMKQAQAQEEAAQTLAQLAENYDALLERVGRLSDQIEAMEDLLEGKLDRLMEVLTADPEKMAKSAKASDPAKKDK